MYLMYAGPNEAKASFFESVLYGSDPSKTLVAVTNGYELLCYLQEVKKGEAYPALIILEMAMPKLAGMETLEFLKADDIYRLIPVLVLYATATSNDLDFCERLGADCMQQPTSNTTWQALVDQVCDRCAY